MTVNKLIEALQAIKDKEARVITAHQDSITDLNYNVEAVLEVAYSSDSNIPTGVLLVID